MPRRRGAAQGIGGRIAQWPEPARIVGAAVLKALKKRSVGPQMHSEAFREAALAAALARFYEGYRPERGTPVTYAYWCARYGIRDAWRDVTGAANRREGGSPTEAGPPAPAAASDADLSRLENEEAVGRLLAGLSARERRIVEGRIVEGRTLREMAEELGVTRERVRQIQVSAVQKMRRRAASRG